MREEPKTSPNKPHLTTFTMKTSAMFAGLAAAFSSVVTAYHAPVGEPSGNSIIVPGLNDQVPAGKPYTIQWQPTTPNPVSLILLRGPGENIKFHSVIIEGIPNNGVFEWTPSLDLENDITHYGIQLIDDVTGQYQYSTQFGVSNPDQPVPKPVSSTPAATATVTPVPTTPAATATVTPTPIIPASSNSPVVPVSSNPPVAPVSSKSPIVTYETLYETVSECDCTEKPTFIGAPIPTGAPISTGTPIKHNNNNNNNNTIAASTGYVGPIQSAPVEDLYTGAATQMKAGGVMVAVVAVVAAALF